MHFIQNSDDLSTFAKSVGLNAPYLAVCSTPEETTYHVIVEHEPMCELTSFGSAIIHMMGSYYMYNIQRACIPC